MRRQGGVLRAALIFALLLMSLSLVIHRQSHALAVLREMDHVRNELAMIESQRAELARRIQKMESRGYVVGAAGQRLGMHIPSGPEIVILPLSPQVAPARAKSPVSGALAFAAKRETITP